MIDVWHIVGIVVPPILMSALALSVQRITRWMKVALEAQVKCIEALKQRDAFRDAFYEAQISLKKADYFETKYIAELSQLRGFASRRQQNHVVVDDKTRDLVRLATSNPSEHERQTAAAIVCKRLMEQMTGTKG